MRPLTLLFAGLFAALACSAQQSNPSSPISPAFPASSAASDNLSGLQFRISPSGGNTVCPVSLSIGPQQMVYLRQTGDSSGGMYAQHLRIDLTNMRAQGIVAIDAHVQGVPGVPHVSLMPVKPGLQQILPAGQAPSAPAADREAVAQKMPRKNSPGQNASKDAVTPTVLFASRLDDGSKLPPPVAFHAELNLGGHGNQSFEWTIRNVGGIRWVQIDRVVYADGSVWQRSAGDVCKSRQNPLVLVDFASK